MYGAPPWSQLACDSRLVRLERQYRNVLKICCGLTKDTPAEHIYDATQMMTFFELAQEQFQLAIVKSSTHPNSNLETRRTNKGDYRSLLVRRINFFDERRIRRMPIFRIFGERRIRQIPIFRIFGEQLIRRTANSEFAVCRSAVNRRKISILGSRST